MSLINKLSKRILGISSTSAEKSSQKGDGHRKCRFEVLEERRVLSADPVIAGVTYLEGDSGQDTTPDYFEVSFEGGSESTQLTQFTINGDQDSSGTLSDGDMFSDHDSAAPGTSGYFGFQFDAANSTGVTEKDILGVTISEDGLKLTVNVSNFEAGDVLGFTIDVDEVERFRVDKIASGVEFEGTFFDATFVDENYTFEDRNVSINAELIDGFVQPQSEGIFYDEYDQLFAEGKSVAGNTVNLQLDNETGQLNRTAAAIDAYNLIEKPISISGTVFHDEDLDCIHDGDEEGIENVRIELQRLNTSTGAFETVATTTTDANGNYQFGEELGIKPGEFRLVETQPDGYLDVGASAGSAGGTVFADRDAADNVIGNIQIPLGGTAATDYDFKEVRPAQIGGSVFHDVNNDGVQQQGEEGIANVLIQVTRVGAKDGVAVDPFAGTTPISIRTDANGNYSVDGLPPGIYEIVEVNSYPGQADPLAPFIDGKDAVGEVAGSRNGTLSNDRFSNIELCADDKGIEYNFGEIKPSSISGYVSVDVPGQTKLGPTDPSFKPIAGVTIQLLGNDGSVIETTQTDQNGRYEFDDLLPGTYSVVEVQPEGFLDGGDVVGTVADRPVGSVTNDRFDGITLVSGQDATRYDFCEHEPASIKGTVYHDVNNNGRQDSGEAGIAGVLIELMDSSGNILRTTTTDANGDYCFEDLLAGDYMIAEQQPTAYIDGRESLGQIDGVSRGVAKEDGFNVTLNGGDDGVEYDFGELLPATVSGFVHTDNNEDCVFDQSAGESPLANVEIELLDANGNVVESTFTDANGYYEFDSLIPGTYSLRQVQPEDYFTGGERVNNGNGTASENLLANISVGSGDRLVDYNFCEHTPAEIHGRVWEDGPAFESEDGSLPDNYRSLRDGVFQAGVDTPLEGVRMQLYYYFDPANNQLEPRAVTLGEVMGKYYAHMNTSDPNAAVYVDTMADGEYWFQGLPAGSYVVLESQPQGFADANDMPGPTQNGTSGTTFNSENEVRGAIAPLTRVFSDAQLQDAVANIVVDPGGISTQNNFTEVRSIAVPVDPPQDPPPPGTPQTPQVPGNPIRPNPGLTGFPGLAGSQAGNFISIVGSSGGIFAGDAAPDAYSWHLSVINGGLPRTAGLEIDDSESAFLQTSYIRDADWDRFDMDDAVWSFTVTNNEEINAKQDGNLRFGTIGGIPISGDFDGNGIDEVAIFKDGFWMIDINHNGTWDQNDLLAKLGDSEDRPVVGDWDGDGKDDIGIYGPMWERDEIAIERDPGLPNPDNSPYTDPKNVPPTVDEATSGGRVMKLTSYGREQADVVDHVFGLDDGEKTPIAGDWNGNGIRSIGTFLNGEWQLDVNGDGRFDHLDETVRFGQAGDRPVVGDFNGDGIEEIAIYRNGTWIVDSNGNRELDITDRTFELGGVADRPVVGDWDGDGTDEPAIYSEQVWNEFN